MKEKIQETTLSQVDTREMSDQSVLEHAEFWGYKALNGRAHFAAMLPVIKNRKLYLKLNFASVFEFAARIGGMGRKNV